MGDRGCQGINNTGSSKLQQKRGSRSQPTWQVTRAARLSQVRQTRSALPWPGSQRGMAACVPPPDPAVLPRGSVRARTGTIQSRHESMSPEYSKPLSGNVTTCTCATWFVHPMPAVLSNLIYAFLEMHPSGLIFAVFLMSRKLFLFVCDETNLSFFFWTQNAMLLLSWTCLARVAAVGGLCWHVVSADLVIFLPVVVLIAMWTR